MQRLILQRVIIAFFVMLTASLLSFTLLFFAPGNPAEAIIKQRSLNDPTIAEINLFMENKNLNKPFTSQCFQWLYMVSHGDFGHSLKTDEPVAREFFDRFGATLELALVAMLLSILIAIPLGVYSAVKQNTIIDHLTRFLALFGVSIPEFWLGIMLMVLFALMLGWLPCFGHGTVKHFILPAVTLSIGITASMMRLVRSSMLEVLHLDYIKTARAKGLKESLIIWKHALKNAMVPIVTVFGNQFGYLLAGAVVVETIFSWPGIGKYLIDAIYARDYPVIQGFVFIIAAIFVLVNLFVDIIYAYLDPRIRYEKGMS